MIIRLLLLLALPLLAYWLAQRIAQRVALTRNQHRWLLISIAGLLVVAVLIAMGRVPAQLILAPLGLAATTLFRLLPSLLRFLPMLQMLRGRASASGPRGTGQESRIRTRYLAMVLNHDSAEMSGEVLVGEYAGRPLSSLGLDELLRLLHECRGDGDSAQLLQAFLSREHPDWRESAGGDGGAPPGAGSEEMTRENALAILGLEAGAERAEIVAAHRELMRKLHPDRGGNDYLAQKVNAAKDVLLG